MLLVDIIYCNQATMKNTAMPPCCPPRERLSLFQSKCWSSAEDDGCRPGDGCLPLMDPELLLGEEPECRKAFVATLGTVLHHPCSCNGVHNDHALTCARIHDVLHNRSLFSEYGLNSPSAIQKKKIQTRQKLSAFIFQRCLGRAAADL